MAYAKWFEARPTKSTASEATINIIGAIVLPVRIVSDNARQFKLYEI